MMQEQSSVTFWQARLAQALLIFIGITAILPVVWRVVAALISKLIYPTTFSIFDVLSRGVYWPALVTGIVLGLVVALRSATWGAIGWRFMIIATLAVSLMIDLLIRVFGIFGFGKELFFLWMLSWLVTGAVGYSLLRFTALDQRYRPTARPLLLKALAIVIVYGIYVPAFYTLLKLGIIYNGDRVAYLAGRKEFIGTLELASFFIAALIVVGLIAKLRRGGMHYFSLIWPVAVIFFFLFLHLCIAGFSHFGSWLYFYVLFAGLCIGFSTVLLVLLDDKTSTCLEAGPSVVNRQKFAFIVFIILALIAVPMWQSLTIIWRSLIFGLPPSAFFTARFHIAVASGVCFAVPCALYAWKKQHIRFTNIFITALCSSFLCSFFPTGHLGFSLGFLFDHLFWQMLVFGPIAVVGWYVLSRMPQIKRGAH